MYSSGTNLCLRHPAEMQVPLQQLRNNPPMDHSGMNMVMQLIILWIKDSNLKVILLKMCTPLHAALNKKQEWLCAFSLSWHYFINPCLFLQATISTRNIKGNSKRKWLPRESKSVCSMSPNTERHIITNFNATMHVYTHMYTCSHVYMCTKCNLLLLYTYPIHRVRHNCMLACLHDILFNVHATHFAATVS